MYLILNKELEAIAEITTLFSINWEEEFLSESGGDFEIVLPASGYPEIRINDIYIIYKTDSLKFGIVNHIEYIDNFTEDEEIQQQIKIKGNMGESILKQRVLSFQLNKSGTLNEIVKNIINTHFTNPKDVARQVNLKYVEDSTFSDYISKSVTGCTVAELLVSLCSSKKFSYQVYLSLEEKKFYIKLIRGEDRSSNVVFCKADDNLKDFTYIKSKENFVSHVIVSGEGEGDKRTTVTVSNTNKSGLDRIEKFLDKKSMSSKDMETGIYVTKLYEEGSSELSKYSVEEALSFDIFLNNYEYAIDFNLGDKVSVKNENLGITTITRVLAVLVSIDENGVETKNITLGDITEIVLKEDETKVDQVEYTEQDATPDSTSDTKITSINTEYIKVYGEEQGEPLNNHEFSGGLFKIADHVFVIVLKNNCERTVDNIYYFCSDNLLQSENIINVMKGFEIECYDGHIVDEDTNKHSYKCRIPSYANLTKVVEFGEPYEPPKLPENLVANGGIITYLADSGARFYSNVYYTGYVAQENNSQTWIKGPEFGIVDSEGLWTISSIKTAKISESMNAYGNGSIRYKTTLAYGNPTSWETFEKFYSGSVTYSVSCEKTLYYEVFDEDSNIIKSMSQVENGQVSAANGQTIKFYVAKEEGNTLSTFYKIDVSIKSTPENGNNYTLKYKNRKPLIDADGYNICHDEGYEMNTNDFQLEEQQIQSITISNLTNYDDFSSIINSGMSVPSQIDSLLNIYTTLRDSKQNLSS